MLSRACNCRLAFVLFFFVSSTTVVSQAKETPAKVWSFQSHVSSKYSTLLVVNDPLPHIEKLLQSGTVEQLFNILKEAAPKANAIQDPTQLLQTVQENKSFVPTETVIGVSPSSYVQGTRFCRICLLTGLYAFSSPEDTTATLSKFKKQLLAEIKQFRIPDLVVYAEFRDGMIPTQAMALVPLLAQQLGNKLQSKQTPNGLSYRLQMKVGDMLPPPVLIQLMQNTRAFTGDKAGDMQVFANAIGQLSIDVKFEKIGNALRLTLQPPSRSPKPLTNEDMASLWNGSHETIYYLQWDITPLKKPWLALRSDWMRWKSTPAATTLLTFDDGNLLADLELSKGSLERASGSGALVATSGDSLNLTIHEEGFPPTPSLAEFPVVELFPKA